MMSLFHFATSGVPPADHQNFARRFSSSPLVAKKQMPVIGP